MSKQGKAGTKSEALGHTTPKHAKAAAQEKTATVPSPKGTHKRSYRWLIAFIVLVGLGGVFWQVPPQHWLKGWMSNQEAPYQVLQQEIDVLTRQLEVQNQQEKNLCHLLLF